MSKKAEEDREENVPMQAAAKLLELSELSVRGLLIYKPGAIGYAWKNEESGYWKYHISPYLLGRYVGMTKAEIYKLYIENIRKVENER